MMVSTGLLALAVATFAALLPIAARGTQMVGNYQQASSLVQHKIDELRSVGYGRLTYTELLSAGIIDAAPTTSPFNFATVDGLNSIYPNATGTIDITNFSTSIRQVTVTVTWDSSSIKQCNGSLQAVALIAKG